MDKERLWIDEQGRDFLAQPGKHYIPGNARTWLPVNRNFHYWRVVRKQNMRRKRAGGKRMKKVSYTEHMADAERPILWERKRDGRRLNMGAWRLRPLEDTKEKRVMLEDDAYGDAMRPWQVVAIMSRERLDELIHQKRRHDEDCRRASRGGPPVVEDGVFPTVSVSHLLEGNATTDENEVVDNDVVKNARRSL